MNTYVRSMAAGFVATVVLSGLMLIKSAMGVMPALDVVTMLSGMAHSMIGLPDLPIVGWVMHFMVGTVIWGALFARFYTWLPGSGAVVKGLSFAVWAWLMMMLLAMPMAGAGFWGLKLGLMAPMMTLALHLVWGAVLGYIFQMLAPRTSQR